MGSNTLLLALSFFLLFIGLAQSHGLDPINVNILLVVYNTYAFFLSKLFDVIPVTSYAGSIIKGRKSPHIPDLYGLRTLESRMGIKMFGSYLYYTFMINIMSCTSIMLLFL